MRMRLGADSVVSSFLDGGAENSKYPYFRSRKWTDAWSGQPMKMPLLSLRARDNRYDGQITLEINDLVLPSALSYQEKISLLKQEIAVIRKAFKGEVELTGAI